MNLVKKIFTGTTTTRGVESSLEMKPSAAAT